MTDKKQRHIGKRAIELVIFNIRWLLIPFFFKLIWTLCLLMKTFFLEKELPTSQLVATLEDLDIVMIANLIKMIITGSYNSFVSKDHGYHNENISSGVLKIKMGTSLIGVSSIHLLQTFVNDQGLTSVVWKQIAIHGCFIVGGFMLAIIDHIHVRSENIETDIETKNEQHENSIPASNGVHSDVLPRETSHS